MKILTVTLFSQAHNALKTGPGFKRLAHKQRASWLKIAENLKDIENDQLMTDTLQK